jgi:hypothetical protein
MEVQTIPEEKYGGMVTLARHTQYVLSREEALSLDWEIKKNISYIEVNDYTESMQFFFCAEDQSVVYEEYEDDQEMMNYHREEIKALKNES